MARTKHPRRIYAGLLSLAVSGAFAQGQPGQLEEVIVVARKSLENLQEVPLTIVAFTERTLERTGISNADDLALLTPGLQSGRQTGASTPFLRGIGTQSSAAGDESSIATYVDGVYSPSMASNTTSFNNIERIEVLKGPQGTLFGRNATGGLINIITKDPSSEHSGDLEISYGNYDTHGARAYLTAPLNEQLAANIALLYSDQNEGWGENRVTGSDVNLETTKAVRTKLLWDAGDATSATLGLFYSEVSSDIGIARQVAPGALGGDGLIILAGCVAGLGGNPAAPTPAEAGACIPVAADNASRYSGDWYDITSNIDPLSDKKDWGTTLHVNHSMGNYELLSITAYQNSENPQLMDVDASALSVNDAVLDIEMHTFSQELQLSYAGDGDLRWILGLFYMDASSEYQPFQIDGLAVPLAFPGATSVRSFPEQVTTSMAAFYQATWDITDNTAVTGGVRLSRDERELTTNLQVDPGIGFYVPIDQGKLDETWTEPTWHLSINHNITDSIMLFGTYSRGFKSGVYNLAGDVATPAAGGPSVPVDPEILDAFEVGVKSDLLDRRLRLNASVFFYKYEDIQVQRVENGQAKLVNAAEAEIVGLDAEMHFLITNNLTISSGLSLLDSEYTSFELAPFNTPTGFGGNNNTLADVSGNELIRSPEMTLNLGFIYELPTAHGLYGASLHYFYNDGFYWEPENRLEQASYEVVNAELSWLSPSEHWRLRLFGKNLLDEEYSYYGNSAQLGDAVSAAPPLTAGVGASYHF